MLTEMKRRRPVKTEIVIVATDNRRLFMILSPDIAGSLRLVDAAEVSSEQT
jgi:hypothetical protein